MNIGLSFPIWFALALPLAAAAAPLPLLPAPAQAELGDGQLPLTSAFTVGYAPDLDRNAVAAVDRLLAAWAGRTNVRVTRLPAGRSPATANLVIEGPRSPAPRALPALEDDESYTLEISPRQAILRAQTDPGVVHGLATLQQLPMLGRSGWSLPVVVVKDRPRFPWRGLLIDVARRWKSLETLERTLDGMALVKLNVLHLHVTDDQGFRIECKRHPELTAHGSDGQFYTQTQIRALIAYAAARGIRVVPEFDLPGHATSWLVSHPELASGPGPFLIERHWGVFDPVMDPTSEATYALIKDVFTEMAGLFPDPYFHLGGDENNGVEWSANPRIQTFIRDHRLGDDAGLHAYFNQRVGQILNGLGKRMIGWDEILHPDLPRGDVIESWRGAESLGQAAQQGFSGILAHGFYLDLCHSAADYYAADPLPAGSTLTPQERSRILGGEASMWGEWVSDETIDSRLWPNAAAVAERLWSPATFRDPGEMYVRLEAVDLRLAEAGLRQQSYLAPAAARLLHTGSSDSEIHTVLAFAELVEPVQDYNRGKQQPGSDQLTPLVGPADLARPDSAVARHFAAAVRAYLQGDRAQSASAETLKRFLGQCRLVGAQIAGPLAKQSPGLASMGPVGFQLQDAAQVALEALAALSPGRPDLQTDRDRAQTRVLGKPREVWLARLKADAEPHDAVSIALLEPIRQLVLAAPSP